MTARELLAYFLSKSDWVDSRNTVDRIIVGDPDEDFERCAVTWIPGLRELEAALADGRRFVVTHEPTFYDHHDRVAGDAAEAKRAFLERNGFVILRIHDCWDRWPATGIPFAWARFLGLPETPDVVGGDGYLHGYDLPPTRFGDLAEGFARRLAALGEPRVQVFGDLGRSVRRIGIGTGCACDFDEYRRMGCDSGVFTDDGAWYWGPLQKAIDLDFPGLRVNHGTSEEPGTATLAEHVGSLGLDARFIPHGCSFRLIG